MTLASKDDLLSYLADLIEEVERFAVTVLPPADGDEVVLGEEAGGSLVIDIGGRLPVSRSSRSVDLDLFERWQPSGPDRWACVEYRYELRHHELGYRRAFHRHDVDACVSAFGVATHEHCESTMGVAVCGHYFGRPVRDASDGFRRLYDTWLAGRKVDCSPLTCLG
jgi:hypothetical protein